MIYGVPFQQLLACSPSWVSVSTKECFMLTTESETHVSPAERLNLGGTGFSGSIPTTLGNLSDLRIVSLAGLVGLTGTIPTELGRLSRLGEFEPRLVLLVSVKLLTVAVLFQYLCYCQQEHQICPQGFHAKSVIFARKDRFAI